MEGNWHRKGRCSLTPTMLAYNHDISSTIFNHLDRQRLSNLLNI